MVTEYLRTFSPEIKQGYESLWRQSGVEERHLAWVEDRINSLINHLRPYDPDRDDSPTDLKDSIEMLAYTTTEILAQLCAGGMTWLTSDKPRFLAPTVDLETIVRERVLSQPGTRGESGYIQGNDYYNNFFKAVKLGSGDFLQVAERTQSWFEALQLSQNELSYLLWAAYKTLRLLHAQERIPGFTPIALSSKVVLDNFHKCESSVQSVLYMQLIVDGLLPPLLQVQWMAESYQLDLAIPSARIAIECSEPTGHNKERDQFLREQGWVVLRFSANRILLWPSQCSTEVHAEYPWTTIPDGDTSAMYGFANLIKVLEDANFLYDEPIIRNFGGVVAAAKEHGYLRQLQRLVAEERHRNTLKMNGNRVTLEYNPIDSRARARMAEAEQRIAVLTKLSGGISG